MKCSAKERFLYSVHEFISLPNQKSGSPYKYEINFIIRSVPGLFLPSYRALKQYHGPKRKTKRQDHEAPMPTEIDINFLKVRSDCIVANIICFRIVVKCDRDILKIT